MKTVTSKSIQKVFFIFCFLSIVFTYAQVKKVTPKTLFGKEVKASSVNPETGIIRCGTVEYEESLQEKNPKRLKEAQFEAWLSPLVTKHKVLRFSSKTAMPAVIITIPVVVHVIHNGEAVGTAPNITDAQVRSQITVLNQDFRKMLGTPGHNTNPVGADLEIEFVLAKVDPNGNPTNGIDRVNMGQASWPADDVDGTVKPATIWDSTQYMNMWSVKFDNNRLLGYAQFPDSSGLPGLNSSNGNENTDGVVASFDVFGSNDFGSSFLLLARYNKGRTMTHEVGHFLGLRHVFGDGNGDEASNSPDCTATDYCADTPQVGWEHHDCNKVYNTCPAAGNDMVENYMDYTPDQCMNIFTLNQKDRIMTVLNNSPRRNSLKTSTKGMPAVPIDAAVKIKTLNSSIPIGCSAPLPSANKEVSIVNRGTSVLTSVTINYNIDNQANQTLEWKGSLETGKSADVILPNTNKIGNLTVSVRLANGSLDLVEINNISAVNYFNLETANFSFTNYVFNLQPDFWSSEITWNIKDAAGAIKYSGGPYQDSPNNGANLPALITQNWQLEKNQCYTFTINDSADNGICCDSGFGFYNIKSLEGETLVASGASYNTTENQYFSTYIAPNELFNSVYLYPNPSVDKVNIKFESNSYLPDSFIINNVLGQQIIQKIIVNNEDLIIDVSNFSEGIYFVTVTKDNQTKTLQFIKE